MCYVNMITWLKCGHFTVVHQKCDRADRKSPPTFCLSAHEPIATDIEAAQGVCPDAAKHGENRAASSWAAGLGITRTSERRNVAI
jgi:hypothetical protein